MADEGPLEVRLLKRVRALCHVDDRERAEAYLGWLSDAAPAYDSADPVLQAYGAPGSMLAASTRIATSPSRTPSATGSPSEPTGSSTRRSARTPRV